MKKSNKSIILEFMKKQGDSWISSNQVGVVMPNMTRYAVYQQLIKLTKEKSLIVKKEGKYKYYKYNQQAAPPITAIDFHRVMGNGCFGK